MTDERGGASAKSRKWPNPLFGQKLTCPGVVPAKALLMSFRFSGGSKSLIQVDLAHQNNFQSNRKSNLKGHFFPLGHWAGSQPRTGARFDKNESIPDDGQKKCGLKRIWMFPGQNEPNKRSRHTRESQNAQKTLFGDRFDLVRIYRGQPWTPKMANWRRLHRARV